MTVGRSSIPLPILADCGSGVAAKTRTRLPLRSRPRRRRGRSQTLPRRHCRPSRPPIEGATPDEQIAFLVLWYPIVRDRIPQRTSDPARREALLALAERLNAAAWTDADQIVVGLQQAAESLKRLSRVFLRRRRRSKHASTRSTSSGSTASGAEPSKGADKQAQGEHAPAAAVTDPSFADE